MKLKGRWAMTLNEAKSILLQAQETMQYGSQNDRIIHSHNLVNALEFMIQKYDELMFAELDDIALMQHQHRIETNKEDQE